MNDFARRAALIGAAEMPLDTKVTAYVTGLSPRTLWAWSSRETPDRLQPRIRRGRRLFYDPADVRAFLGIDPPQDTRLREQILDCLLAGKTIDEIATELNVTADTVRSHMRAIKQSAGVGIRSDRAA